MELYKPDGSLYFEKDNFEDVVNIVKTLLDNKYVLCLSREDDAYIVDYINTYNSSEANRNDVVFLSREDYEYESWQEFQEEFEDIKEMAKEEIKSEDKPKYEIISEEEWDEIFEDEIPNK